MDKILSVKSNNVPIGNYTAAQNKSVEHNNTESSDKDLSKSAKLMIGADAVAVAIAAGIIIAKRARLPKGPKTEPSIKPDVNLEVKPKPEVKPNTDSINPKTAEKPVEPVKTEEVELDIETLKLELYEKATPLKEFKEIGKFENGKAILNSGEPFNGNMALEKENHRQILLEYKDGVITESTTIHSKSIIESIKRYDNRILKEIGHPNDGIETYSRDKDGNRVITDIGKKFYTKEPYETITKISKQDGNVIKTCDYAKVNCTLLSEQTIYSKNKYVREFILKDQTIWAK